jgi:Tfp pilus assembly protein PilF
VKDRSERIAELRSRKLAEQPLDPALHYEMGVLLLRAGDAEMGERWLGSALALDPDFAPAHTALAEALEKRGETAKAADHRRRAGK